MIYLILPVFNRLHFTIDCIESLKRQTYNEYKIIVVDDGSSDGTAASLENNYPEVIVLRGDGQLWWTGAINMGVKYVLQHATSKEDFILTLNNDLSVGPEYFQNLIKTYQNNAPCLVGSVTVDIDNPELVNYCGVKWNEYSAKQRSPIELPISLKELQSHAMDIESDLLPGRGVLIPLKVFDQIGLYDAKNFPHYAADEDFSLRARKAGYRLMVSSNAFVYSYIRESNLAGKHTKRTLAYWYDFFFSIKSSCNLRNRYHWARKHAKYPLLYFTIDLSRICYSQIKSCIY